MIDETYRGIRIVYDTPAGSDTCSMCRKKNPREDGKVYCWWRWDKPEGYYTREYFCCSRECIHKAMDEMLAEMKEQDAEKAKDKASRDKLKGIVKNAFKKSEPDDDLDYDSDDDDDFDAEEAAFAEEKARAKAEEEERWKAFEEERKKEEERERLARRAEAIKFVAPITERLTKEGNEKAAAIIFEKKKKVLECINNGFRKIGITEISEDSPLCNQFNSKNGSEDLIIRVDVDYYGNYQEPSNSMIRDKINSFVSEELTNSCSAVVLPAVKNFSGIKTSYANISEEIAAKEKYADSLKTISMGSEVPELNYEKEISSVSDDVCQLKDKKVIIDLKAKFPQYASDKKACEDYMTELLKNIPDAV